MKICGVYAIENIVNGKLYIGSAIDIKKRWSEHKFLLRNNRHPNKYLMSAWNKHGEDKFKFKIIEETTLNELIKKEQYYITYYETSKRKYGYNLAPNAGNTLGIKCSEEKKEKIRKSLLGKKRGKINYVVSEETRKKMSESRMGYKPSLETCQKLSAKLKGNKNASGRVFSENDRNELSKKMLGKNRGENNGMAISNINEIIAIRNDYSDGMTISKLTIKYNKKNSFIYNVVKRLRWNWV